MISCTKRWDNFPFAHRQPKHKGHCSLVHGHNWSFEFQFVANVLDANGFVVDFGDLKWLKQWLDDNFDHTLVLNEDDPEFDKLRTIPAKIVLVPNCGAEGLASWLFDEVSQRLRNKYDGRVELHRVTVFEDTKNSASCFKS